MNNQQISKVGGSYKQILTYLIQCVTPLHVGSGQSYEGFVDLPIQRDNLGFPIIWGSSIKGAMRNTYYYNNKNNKNKDYGNEIFGPYYDEQKDYLSSQYDEQKDYASSITILDASSLLIPVRSLYGLFAFVTHSYLLRQAAEKLSLANKQDIVEKINELLKKYENKCIVSDEYIIKDSKAVLKEEDIMVEKCEDLKSLFNSLLPNNLSYKNEILKRIVVLNDDYVDILKRSTLIQTRIKVNYDKKTVEGGALWTEEYLPELSILMTALLINERKLKIDDILTKLSKGLNSDNNLNEFYLVIGGNETIGKGIVKFYKT